MGTPIAGLPGTNYKICWGHDIVALGRGNEGYRVPAGALVIAGPIQGPHVCTMSTPCNLVLTGTNLATTNKVLIVIGNSCAGTPATFAGLTNPKRAKSSDAYGYELGIPSAGTPGNAYSICWAHEPSSNADFLTRLGTFSINGPTAVALAECTLGLPCVVTVSGFGLASTNKILVVQPTDTCGTDNVNVVAMAGLTNPAVIGNTLQNPLGHSNSRFTR